MTTTIPTDLVKVAQQFMQGQQRQRIGMSPWAVDANRLADSFKQVESIRSPNADAPMAISRRGVRMASGSFATRIGNTAIVPVIGPLMSRFSWSYWSYDEIIRDLRLSAAEEGIRDILMDVDSPGGMVANCDAVVDEVARIRETMPVHAHIGGLGASAAYWIASAAETVTSGKTGLVGSIGALIRYVDMEGIFTKLGGRVVEVIAEQSPNKRLDPDSEEGQAELQAIVDSAGELFVQGLVKQRGVSRETIMEKYGQGLVFPAETALKNGLIDDVMSFEEILAKLADRQGSLTNAESAAAPANKENTMTGKDQSAANDGPLTLDALRSDHSGLVASLENDAAAAERARITGIDEQAKGLSGHDDLIAAMKADGKTTPAEAAVQLLAAEKAKPAADKAKVDEQLKGLAKLDEAAKGIQSDASETGEHGERTFEANPDGWKAQWEASEKLQAQFPSAESYAATMKRDSQKA